MFVRLPEVGRVKTRLAPALTTVGATALYRAFVEDLCERLSPRFAMTLACTPSARAPYFRRLAARHGLTCVDQEDGDLGARMERVAIAGLARAERVVIIGSDVPTMPASVVDEAFDSLRRHRVVLGPGLDGGYYLVGVRQPIAPIFARMRWGDDGVLARTIRRLRRARVSHAFVPSWYDVDTAADLHLLRRHVTLLATLGENPCPRTARMLRRLNVRRGGGAP